MAIGTATVHYPPFADCSECLSSDVEWFEVTGTGRLVSFSKLTYGPVGFEDDLPYAIAILDYGNYKVFGRIDKNIPDEDLNIGMAMKTEPITLPNDQLSYVFAKAQRTPLRNPCPNPRRGTACRAPTTLSPPRRLAQEPHQLNKPEEAG